MSDLTNLLSRCTVRVSVKSGSGSGFFVAPGRLLTCAHVVQAAVRAALPVQIQYESGSAEAEILTFVPKHDLALLSIDDQAHRCAYLAADVEPPDTLYAYGYPGASSAYGDYSRGDSLTVEYEGSSAEPFLLKLKGGQIVPGFSGSPVLNLRTGAVCGMLTLTRDDRTDLGGRAIPVATVWNHVAGLEQEQKRYHADHGEWLSLMPRQVRAAAAWESRDRAQIIQNFGSIDTVTNINQAETVNIGK
jgi:S1-C subfamily serine protease